MKIYEHLSNRMKVYAHIYLVCIQDCRTLILISNSEYIRR